MLTYLLRDRDLIVARLTRVGRATKQTGHDRLNSEARYREREENSAHS